MTDTDLLATVLAAAGLSEDNQEIFARMLDDIQDGKRRGLSEKQRAWVQGVGAQLGVVDDPGAANLVSSGKVKPTPKERESLTAFLGSMRRPLKPPGRSP